jgi:5-oxoprolinase (ATP-hydrolysing)
MIHRYNTEHKIQGQSYDKNEIKTERYLNMRFQGTDNAIMIMGSEDKDKMYHFDASFRAQFQREHGFELAIVPGHKVSVTIGRPETIMKHQVFFENGWEEVSVFISDNLQHGHVIIGPALIIQPI